MFTKSQRSSFPYWFAHWCAYNMTALNLGCWKFRFLFHDIWKPFQKLIYKDYSKVQYKHRYNNKHHLSYWINREFSDKALTKLDYLGMIIDWECSRYTKAAAQKNAYETYLEIKQKLIDGAFNYYPYNGYYVLIPTEEQIQYFSEHIEAILKQLNLYHNVE